MGGVALLEKHAVLQSPSRIEELVRIFIHATKVWVLSERDPFVPALTCRVDGGWVLGSRCRSGLMS